MTPFEFVFALISVITSLALTPERVTWTLAREAPGASLRVQLYDSGWELVGPLPDGELALPALPAELLQPMIAMLRSSLEQGSLSIEDATRTSSRAF